MGQRHRAQRRIKRGKEHIRRQHARLRHAIEQRRLSCIGVADKSNDWIRHAPAADTMQRAGAFDGCELAFDFS